MKVGRAEFVHRERLKQEAPDVRLCVAVDWDNDTTLKLFQPSVCEELGQDLFTG